MNQKNYYDILGVSSKASAEEITAAKNALAKRYHPDANVQHGIDTTDKMQEILEAYRTLSDPAKRKSYDRALNGHHSVMRTFDLFDEEEQQEKDSGFVIYWKAANTLHEIISEGEPLFHKREAKGRLSALAIRALRPIVTLRTAQIPERYWHPDIMNWLLFTSYQHPNYTVTYLLALYDNHVKTDYSIVDRAKASKAAARYEHTVKKLIKR
ncbi:MAG: DnaJ domain-containing protein [Lachnospiraceae bacterium]|nr:DnaJ domain-containing protein [Lachnospiraceae bacterium]